MRKKQEKQLRLRGIMRGSFLKRIIGSMRDDFTAAAAEAKRQFLRMFPDKDYDKKYVLWINFGLDWDGYFKALDCRVRVLRKDGTFFQITNIRTRPLYENVNLNIACMRMQKRSSDCGIIIPFDSFEELDNVKQVQIYWTVYGAFPHSDIPYHIFVNYDVSFELAEGKQSYSLVSHDVPLLMIAPIDKEECSLDDFGHCLNHYDKVFLLLSSNENYSFYKVDKIKGVIESDAAFGAWDGLSEAFKDDFKMECFLTKVVLKAEAYPAFL